MNGKVEALEFIVSPDFGYTGIPVKQLDLKPDILLAGIIRGGKNIIPCGDDVILPDEPRYNNRRRQKAVRSFGCDSKMKIKLVFHTVGRVLLLEAALMLLPACRFADLRRKLLAFFCDIGCCGAVVGAALKFFCRSDAKICTLATGLR